MLLRQLTANSSSPGLTGLKAHQARTDACTARVRVLHHKAVALTVALGLLTAGCGINESTYERAPLPEVASFPQAQHYLGPQIAAEFWRGFGDPLLDACIAKALTANYDIRTAAVRVEQALLNLDISRTDRHPTASAQVELSGRRSLSEGEAVQKSSSSSFAVSYEADVFGKVAAAKVVGEEDDVLMIASDGSIIKEFMGESMLLGFFGGLLGAAFGFVIATSRAALAYGAHLWCYFPAGEVALCFLFSLAAGVLLSALASMQPSWSASRMAPMEAMRVE